jgi:hypothetical protein
LFRTAPKTQTVTIMRDHGATTSHDDHGSSAHGKSAHESGGSHALNGIGTLIINAEDGTVNIHIHGAAPTAGHHHTAQKTKTTFGFALDDVTNKSKAKATVRGRLLPSFLPAKKPSKKKAKKPSKKKPSKNKKKKDTKSSNKKINDEVRPLSA